MNGVISSLYTRLERKILGYPSEQIQGGNLLVDINFTEKSFRTYCDF